MNTDQTTELDNGNDTPCPLERRVGRRTGKEWLLALALAFRSWLLNIRRNTRNTAIAPYSHESRLLDTTPKINGAGPYPMFDLRGPDGEIWMLYEDGTITGFPDGTRILNRAIPLLNSLRGRIKQLEASSISRE